MEVEPEFECTCWRRQIGAGQRKAKQLTKPELGHFKAAGVPLKQHLAEFPVTEDAILPVGAEVSVRHFRPGQYVDIAGITTGKGFQVRTDFPALKFSVESSNRLVG